MMTTMNKKMKQLKDELLFFQKKAEHHYLKLCALMNNGEFVDSDNEVWLSPEEYKECMGIEPGEDFELRRYYVTNELLRYTVNEDNEVEEC